jgi:hypothetical protein
MKLEFYNKATGEACGWQNCYLVDRYGEVFEEFILEDGWKLDHRPSLSFRIIEENT